MAGPVAGSSLTDIYPILKEYYEGQPVRNLLSRKHVFLSMVRKDTKFRGKYYPQPLRYGTSTGSSQFSVAQANQSPDLLGEFQVPPVFDYTLATIQNSAREAAGDDMGSFADAAKIRIDGAMEDQYNRMGNAIYRSGTGTIGKISSAGISGGMLTLANPNDALFFQAGQVLVANSTDGGGTQAGGLGYVIAVDTEAGKIVVSTTQGGSPGTPSGWLANYYLSAQGDLNSRMAGLLAWLPTGANRPTAGVANNLFGVNRGINPTLLAGVYADLSGESIEDAFIDGQSEVCRLGGDPDIYVCNPASRRALVKAMQTRKIYSEGVYESEAGVGFLGVKIDGDNKPIIVMSDPDCPPLTAFCLQMDTFKLVSYGDAPKILTYEDGLTMFRVGNQDALEARVGGYFNLVCEAPGRNGVFLLPE